MGNNCQPEFDKFASNYREIHNQNIKLTGGTSDYFSEYKILELIQHIKNPKIKILDFGCGDGNSCVFFRKYFPQSTIIGIDVSLQSIDEALKRDIPDAYFKLFDGSKIEYDNDEFDVIFVSCVFHHIEHQYHIKVLKECLRVLKPGAKIYIFEHNPFNPITRKIVKDCVFDEDAVLISSPKFRKMLRLAGFKKIRVNYTLFFPRHKFFKSFIKFEKFFKKLPLGGQYYIYGQK